MQIGVLALTLASRLHGDQSSFARYYLDLLDDYDIRYRFYERQDVTLFDESLQGKEREDARSAGNRRKEATVAFFGDLEGVEPGEVARILQAHLPADTRLPTIERVFHAGDGTLIEMDGMWFELRASGTDAVLRYYMEGLDKESVSDLNTAFTQLDIPAKES